MGKGAQVLPLARSLVGFSLRGCKELDTTEHTCYINGHFRDSICEIADKNGDKSVHLRTFPGNYVQVRIQDPVRMIYDISSHVAARETERCILPRCTPKSEYFSACILQYLPSPIKDKSTVKLSYAIYYAIFHLKRNSLKSFINASQIYLTFLNSFACLVVGNSVLPSIEDKQVELWKDYWKRKMSLSSMDQRIVKEGEIKGQVYGDYYNTSLGLRLRAGSESTRGIILCTLSSIYFCTLRSGLCGTAWYVGIRKYQTSLYLVYYMKTLKFTTHNGMRIEIDDNGDVTGYYDILNWRLDDNGEVAFVKVGEYIVTDSKFELVMIKNATIFWNTESSGRQRALLMCCIYLPHPVCTDVCQPGTWKGIRHGEPICCFDCIPCADGHMSREPDRDDHFSLTLKCNPSSVLCSLGQRECDQCGEGYWSNAQKSECVLKEVEFLAYSEAPGFTLVILSIFGALVVLAVTTVYVMHRHTTLVMPNDRELRFLIQVSLITLALGFSLCLSCILGKTISLFSAYRISKSKTRFISIRPLYRKNIVLTSVIALNPPRVYKNMESQNIKIILECNEGSVEFLCSIFGMDLPQDNYYEGKCIAFGMLVFFFIIWISFVPAYLSTKGKFKVAMEIFAILASSYGLLGCTFAPKCSLFC
ncbi:hypothetical protein FD754_008783 [Muntiacus muntjak]|uniref:G-protein coupled receptors family 3 profile domain-containing protein n=1 Tax=Muntiacus muntjak TaxID=9888 RepID=A0A5N3WUS2_MUNMU|nr:hypothetical protein FD754_008783 [Muntiacus muntjak]